MEKPIKDLTESDIEAVCKKYRYCCYECPLYIAEIDDYNHIDLCLNGDKPIFDKVLEMANTKVEIPAPKPRKKREVKLNTGVTNKGVTK